MKKAGAVIVFSALFLLLPQIMITVHAKMDHREIKRAEYYFNDGNMDGLEEMRKKTQSSSSDYDEISFLIAQLYYKKGNFDRSEKEFKDIITRDQNHARDSHYFLGMITLKRDKDKLKAFKHLEIGNFENNFASEAQKEIEKIRKEILGDLTAKIRAFDFEGANNQCGKDQEARKRIGNAFVKLCSMAKSIEDGKTLFDRELGNIRSLLVSRNPDILLLDEKLKALNGAYQKLAGFREDLDKDMFQEKVVVPYDFWALVSWAYRAFIKAERDSTWDAAYVKLVELKTWTYPDAELQYLMSEWPEKAGIRADFERSWKETDERKRYEKLVRVVWEKGQLTHEQQATFAFFVAYYEGKRERNLQKLEEAGRIFNLGNTRLSACPQSLGGMIFQIHLEKAEAGLKTIKALDEGKDYWTQFESHWQSVHRTISEAGYNNRYASADAQQRMSTVQKEHKALGNFYDNFFTAKRAVESEDKVKYYKSAVDWAGKVHGFKGVAIARMEIDAVNKKLDAERQGEREKQFKEYRDGVEESIARGTVERLKGAWRILTGETVYIYSKDTYGRSFKNQYEKMPDLAVTQTQKEEIEILKNQCREKLYATSLEVLKDKHYRQADEGFRFYRDNMIRRDDPEYEKIRNLAAFAGYLNLKSREPGKWDICGKLFSERKGKLDKETQTYLKDLIVEVEKLFDVEPPVTPEPGPGTGRVAQKPGVGGAGSGTGGGEALSGTEHKETGGGADSVQESGDWEARRKQGEAYLRAFRYREALDFFSQDEPPRSEKKEYHAWNNRKKLAEFLIESENTARERGERGQLITTYLGKELATSWRKSNIQCLFWDSMTGSEEGHKKHLWYINWLTFGDKRHREGDQMNARENYQIALQNAQTEEEKKKARERLESVENLGKPGELFGKGETRTAGKGFAPDGGSDGIKNEKQEMLKRGLNLFYAFDYVGARKVLADTSISGPFFSRRSGYEKLIESLIGLEKEIRKAYGKKDIDPDLGARVSNGVSEKMTELSKTFREIFPEVERKRHRKHLRFIHWICSADYHSGAGRTTDARRDYQNSLDFAQTVWERMLVEETLRHLDLEN